MKKALVKRSDLPTRVMEDRVTATLCDLEKKLAYTTTIHQAKVIADVARAKQVFAARQGLSKQIQQHGHQIEIYALAKLGELLTAIPKATGGQPYQKRQSSTPSSAEGVATYADLGLDYKTAAIAQQLASLSPPVRDAIAAQETTLAQVRREAKKAEVQRVVTLPDAKYRVLYADPPWEYRDKADEGAIQAGGAARHYPMMSIKELCSMPIGSVCEPNAVLFLWVTSPLLFESASVIKAWGFEYKASFVWDKVKHNMGHYNSVRHEFLLICTRGSCTPDVVELFDSVQSIERTEHSVKPEEFRGIIDTLYPNGKRLELFARREVPGWDGYGYEFPVEVAG